MNSPDTIQPQDSAEDLREHDLHTFISVGTLLTQSVVLPAELRARIAEAVIAAKGCQVCHVPLGALHTLSCTLGALSATQRDVVRQYDLNLTLPDEPARF